MCHISSHHLFHHSKFLPCYFFLLFTDFSLASLEILYCTVSCAHYYCKMMFEDMGYVKKISIPSIYKTGHVGPNKLYLIENKQASKQAHKQTSKQRKSPYALYFLVPNYHRRNIFTVIFHLHFC